MRPKKFKYAVISDTTSSFLGDLDFHEKPKVGAYVRISGSRVVKVRHREDPDLEHPIGTLYVEERTRST